MLGRGERNAINGSFVQGYFRQSNSFKLLPSTTSKPHIFTFMRLCYFDIVTLADPKECLINGGAGIAPGLPSWLTIFFMLRRVKVLGIANVPGRGYLSCSLTCDRTMFTAKTYH